MRLLKYLIYCLCLLSIFSCKRSLDKSIIGPEIQYSSNLVVPFQASSSSVNFRLPETNVVKFNGKFEKLTKWKITIKGLSSGATKTLYGNSEDISLASLWNGSQDSLYLYFFRDGEMVIASLSLNNSISSTNVSQNLDNRGDIIVTENEIARDTILIIKGKASNSNQIELFPRYAGEGDCTPDIIPYFYTAGYDAEGEGSLDVDPLVPKIKDSQFYYAVFDSSQNLLNFSKNQSGLKGPKFFMLKGMDVSTKISTEKGPDYYVARLQSVILNDKTDYGNILTYAEHKDPCDVGDITVGRNVTDFMKTAMTNDNLYFNVFVYGNGDGSKINYTIQEDDSKNGFYVGDKGDEAYEKGIVVDFKGWKLFSFKYSDFTKAAFRDPIDGIDKTILNGNGKKDIANILFVQFGLVAGKLGGKAQMIMDNPTVSIGKPFSY
ncbi:MAG: hypothetical protein H7329_14770 [Opitutaceae bacterium]|nr:hypothetical protein [Cytophagales bacterium]